MGKVSELKKVIESSGAKHRTWWNDTLLPALKKLKLSQTEMMGLGELHGKLYIAGVDHMKSDDVLKLFKELGLEDVGYDKYYSGQAWKKKIVGTYPKDFFAESMAEGGKEIADTILKQLGGNKFIVMTGAKNLAHGEDYISFKIGKNAGGVTHVKIRLNSKDLYDMTFYKSRGAELKTLKEYTDVYNDKLAELFTEVTGLYTSLGTMGR